MFGVWVKICGSTAGQDKKGPPEKFNKSRSSSLENHYFSGDMLVFGEYLKRTSNCCFVFFDEVGQDEIQ